jgi:hypothetical protein
MDACPKCKQSRWEDKDGKRVPRKILRHFPLIPRLKRMDEACSFFYRRRATLWSGWMRNGLIGFRME